MKKTFQILGIISGIIITIVGLYILFNIYFVFSQKDHKIYDGFNEEYHYKEPKSHYSLIGVIGFIGGLNLSGYCIRKLSEGEKDK